MRPDDRTHLAATSQEIEGRCGRLHTAGNVIAMCEGQASSLSSTERADSSQAQQWRDYRSYDETRRVTAL
jgi:hypothetical protein